MATTIWELTSAADDIPERLYDLWDSAVDRSRANFSAAMANGGLDQPVYFASLKTAATPACVAPVCDLIEEYGRHTGHADLIREAVDGRVVVRTHPPDGARTCGHYRVTG